MFQSEWDTMKMVTKYVLPVSVIFVGFGYGIGVGPVPFALMGEILPQTIKQFACAFVLSIRFGKLLTNHLIIYYW